MNKCSRCGRENRAEARFCDACGSRLGTQQPDDLSNRRVVTVLFSDLAGSTTLGESHDPEALRRLIGRYFDAMRRVLEWHGGTVEKFIGDAIMTVFGHPITHEDDALRAVKAAAEMRVALSLLNDELEREGQRKLEARIGINTGEVVAGDPSFGHAFVTGDVVNTAKRLEEAASSGEILLGEGTLHFVRDAVRVEHVERVALRGKSLPFRVFRLVELWTETPGVARRLDSPIVNRESELTRLQLCFEDVVAGRRCSLVLVLGAAGIGKSRVVKEFVALLGDRVSVLRGRCVSYSEGVTFQPIVDVIKEAAQLEDADDAEAARKKLVGLIPARAEPERVYERLAGLLGFGAAELPAQEIFWAFRMLLEAVAADRPLVVIFDDVHWGELTFLDLLEYVAGRSHGFPILLCCLGRPDVLERRPSLSELHGDVHHIRLEPLHDEDTRALVQNWLEFGDLAEEVHDHIAELAEGNPLFLEELLQMLIDDGHLTLDAGRWTASGRLPNVRLPPTIQALLAARLDRLLPDERAVAERASVIGPVFSWSAIAELTTSRIRQRLATHLQALVRRDFIQPAASEFAAEDAFAFSHGLVSDAAYASVPKEVRADLHYAYSDWLERTSAHTPGEHEELVAYHLEQVARYGRELSRGDERTAACASKAGALLSRAGKRAFSRGDAPAAAALLERAGRLLMGRPRSEALRELAVAFRDMGELARAEAVSEQARQVAVASGDPQLAARAELEQGVLQIYTSSDGTTEDLLKLVDRTLPVLERAEDDEGLAKAWYLVGASHWARCRAAEMEQVLERALEHARRAGSRRELAFVLNALARAIVAGPTPVDVALERCTAILDEAADDRTQWAIVSTWVALLEAMRGDFERARARCAESQATLDELGQKLRAIALRGYVGTIEMLAGEVDAAERLFRSALDALEPLGERPNMRGIAARLATALGQLGRTAEAERFAELSRETAPADDLVTQVLWRTALAAILSRRGDVRGAEALAREASSLADATDWLNMRGDARMILAEVLRAAGQEDEARVVAQTAARLYEEKGNRVSAVRARAMAGDAALAPRR